MPIERYFKLYLNAGRNVPQPINVNQYDSGETWYFSLFTDNGTAYFPSTGAIIGIKADGHVIDNAATVDNRGRVVVTETEQMTAAPGKAVFELSIDDNSHGTANFIVLVEPKPSENGILSDSDLSLLQEAIDSTNPAAIAEGVSDWMDEHLTPTTPVVDDTLTVQGAAADAKKTGDEIADLKSSISGGGLTNEAKQALLACFENVAWIGDDGQDYYDALEAALYPLANLVSISAVYTQSGAVYTDDTLDDLKTDLVVTAHYDDSSTETVTNYVLSGTLTVGTSTITVSYGGKTTTFNVIVTHTESWDIEWDYTDGLLQNNGFTLLSSNASTQTIESDGVLVANTSSSGSISFGIADEPVPCSRIVYESTFNPKTLATLPATPKGVGYYILFVNNGKGINVAVNSGGLGYYEGKDTATKGWHFASTPIAADTEHTLRLEVDDSESTADLYLDSSFVTTFGIAATSTTQTKIYQNQGGSTLHKSIKIRYEQ